MQFIEIQDSSRISLKEEISLIPIFKKLLFWEGRGGEGDRVMSLV